MEETLQQSILSAITNIKIPGIYSVAYWSILETGDSIFFVQTGSYSAHWPGRPTGYGMAQNIIGDIRESKKAKQAANENITTVLERATQYFGFSKESVNQIVVKKGLFGGGKVIIPNGQKKTWKDSGVIKFKLSRKKFRLFMEMLQRKLSAQ